jgi:REP element-mobilizing transposase RayT
MPRKPRIEFEGAFYHVITRGNQRQKIFKDSSDHQKFIQYLTIYKNRYHYSLYAYVLMGNHVHLLIETHETPLSKILQGINQSYTMYYNRTYRTVGHLFQGRYKAILCDRDPYLLSLLKYIHHNPVRARIVKTPVEYAWSSHQAYMGKNNPYSLVDTIPVLKMFSENTARARQHYLKFMNEGDVVKKQDVYAVIDQRLQGNDDFVDRVLEQYDGEVKKEKKKKERSLPEISRAVTKHTGIKLEHLQSAGKDRQVMTARQLFTLVAKAYGYKGVEIARHLQKEASSVTKYARDGSGKSDLKKIFSLLKKINSNFQI